MQSLAVVQGSTSVYHSYLPRNDFAHTALEQGQEALETRLVSGTPLTPIDAQNVVLGRNISGSTAFFGILLPCRNGIASRCEASSHCAVGMWTSRASSLSTSVVSFALQAARLLRSSLCEHAYAGRCNSRGRVSGQAYHIVIVVG